LSSPPHDVSQLLAEHGRQLHALLFRLTLRSDVADDLLQDLFCKLAQSESFYQANKPVAFAFRTAMNLAFDWRRSKKRLPMTDADISAQQSPMTSVISNLVRREELEQTLTAIGELPTMNRDILVLRYLQQQSYEAIADQFGKTAHQIRALAHKALESLRKLLGADAENGADVESRVFAENGIETGNIEEAQRAEGK
jgi:RNA polymerase sigma factor (sigma-70 family)